MAAPKRKRKPHRKKKAAPRPKEPRKRVQKAAKGVRRPTAKARRAPAKKAQKAVQRAPKKAPSKPAKAETLPKGVVGWVKQFIEKPSTTPEERAAAKASLEPKPKLKRDKRGRLRDYKKEYQRRLQRGEMLQRATTEQPSKAVSRGHPRRKKGEFGLAEIRQLRQAVKLPSQKDQRDMGIKNPVQYEERVIARAFVTEIAGISSAYIEPSKETIKGDAAKRFAEIFVALGLGSLSDAYHLFFSP